MIVPFTKLTTKNQVILTSKIDLLFIPIGIILVGSGFEPHFDEIKATSVVATAGDYPELVVNSEIGYIVGRRL